MCLLYDEILTLCQRPQHYSVVSKGLSPLSHADCPSVTDRRCPRPLATPRPLLQHQLMSPAERSGTRAHRDGSSLTSENLLDWSLYLNIYSDSIPLCFFKNLRLQWREKIRGKSDGGVPISSPASTHLNSARSAGRRYVHFTLNLHLFHVYSHSLCRLAECGCCIWRNNAQRKNRLQLNGETR